ncbi:NAD(P)/FAD-dependent oxidoreductase [Desulfosporosinus fructosivorans]|uniref:NAD(P)/FAD-dependent oxidoreductase n=1 Tax=Desulfosporosinus fructosivorans TaxID=2018669 RepID=A0A4Z0R899_9FIRM|nr:FAD/NAD(P)-binding oxidoreductase [Desulfosporosinus fructosivorans]TGE38635.1 NAD(P)/FAD-dependent oxidoreductase [Desulfosporosinus fructosivorans]
MKKTLILGGGIGGIVAANALKKAMGSSMQVTVVDREPNHYFSSSFPLLMIGERKASKITRDLKQLERKKIKVLRSEVIKLDLPGHRVTTDEGDLDYDYLIISLGVEYHQETVPGFSEFALNAYDFNDVIKTNQRLSSFSSGQIVFFISSLPYKCPPAPYEMMFLLDQFFRQRGLRHKVKLTIVTPDFSPEPLASPKVGQSVRKMLNEKNIEIITEAKVLRVEKNALILDHGTKIPADLLLGVAPHWTPEVLRNTDLVDNSGFVDVNLRTLETCYPSVYAIGDATAIRLPVIGAYAPKAGAFAHAQAVVVAKNIISLSKGLKPRFFYKGKGMCMMNTGFGRARYSTVHYYKKPQPYITLLRPTRLAYWAKVAFEKYWFKRWF